MSHIYYEGWTAQDFIEDLSPSIEIIMSGESWMKPFKDYKSLKQYCTDSQPYYKKYIPKVVDYFAKKYNIKWE